MILLLLLNVLARDKSLFRTKKYSEIYADDNRSVVVAPHTIIKLPLITKTEMTEEEKVKKLVDYQKVLNKVRVVLENKEPVDAIIKK